VGGSDLLQESLLHAAQHVRQFEGTSEEQWRAWLGRIAEREVLRQRRVHLDAEMRTVAREQALAAEGSRSSEAGLLPQLAGEQSTPSVAAMRNERAAVLAEALTRLPEDYRQVVLLRNLEGLDFPEVAQRMNRSDGAVRVLWVRALKRLRDELDAESRGSF
jgi:RNA polymerase sigma-70 factor (ECF subfamily)